MEILVSVLFALSVVFIIAITFLLHKLGDLSHKLMCLSTDMKYKVTQASVDSAEIRAKCALDLAENVQCKVQALASYLGLVVKVNPPAHGRITNVRKMTPAERKNVAHLPTKE